MSSSLGQQDMQRWTKLQPVSWAYILRSKAGLSPLTLKTVLEGSLNDYFQVTVEETKTQGG